MWEHYPMTHCSQAALVVKNRPANAGDSRDTGSIPGSGKFPGEGNGYPLQYSCLDNSMDRGAWWAMWGCKESDTEQLTLSLSFWEYGFRVEGIIKM